MEKMASRIASKWAEESFWRKICSSASVSFSSSSPESMAASPSSVISSAALSGSSMSTLLSNGSSSSKGPLAGWREEYMVEVFSRIRVRDI